MTEELIRKTYYNPESGLFSATKLYEKLKSKGITLKQIKDFISKQEVYQIHKKVFKPEIFFPIVAKYPNEIYQIDLMDFSDVSTTNNNYKYILLCIDVFTRKAYAVPLKTKNMNEVVNAFIPVLNITVPAIVQCDQGSEFINKPFKDLMNDYETEIQYIDVKDHNKLGIINRFCRTFRTVINRYMTMYKTTKYIDVLQKIINNYNNTYHRTIKCTPNEAYKNKDKILKNTMKQWNEAKLTETKFQNGDTVRYVINKAAFAKGSLGKYSKTLHKIIEHSEHTYTLDNDVKCKYYELQKVNNSESHILENKNEPIRENKIKDNKVKRTLAREEMLPENIIQGKRQVKRSTKLKDYV